MEENKKKDLVLSIYAVQRRIGISYEEAYRRFMSGDIFVSHYRTHTPLHPSDYSEFGTISQEARAKIFNNLPRHQVRKSQDRESGTCKIHCLIRRACQLRNELSAIDRQLTETYGIALTDGFLSLQSKCHASLPLRQNGSKNVRSCIHTGMGSEMKGILSPNREGSSDSFLSQHISDQL